MIYVVTMVKRKGIFKREYSYDLFNVLNGDFRENVKEKKLLNMVRGGNKLLNAVVLKGRIRVDKWVSRMYRKQESLPLFKCGKNKVMILDFNGYTEVVNTENEWNKIMNLHKYIGKETLISIEDADINRVNSIRTKYKDYRVKSRLLGNHSYFTYVIIDKEVVIVNCSRGSKKLVVPRFVTGIWEDVIEKCEDCGIPVMITSSTKYLTKDSKKYIEGAVQKCS